MKHYLFIFALAVFGLAACHSKNDEIKAFIPGIYTRSVSGEFSRANDTLVITRVNGDFYQITRHTGYQVIRNGGLLPEQHKTETFTGTYDEQRQVLQETVKGKAFTFDPVKRTLTVNNKGVYTKRD